MHSVSHGIKKWVKELNRHFCKKDTQMANSHLKMCPALLVIKEMLIKTSPGISLEEMMLKLKLQYFGHLMQRVDSLEKTLMLGGIGGRRRRGWQEEMAGWHYCLDRREFEWTPGIGDGQGGLGCCDSWGCKESDTTERLNWTELNWIKTTVRYHVTSVRMGTIKKQSQKITNIGKNVKKLESLCTVVGNAKWCCPYGKQYDDASKNFK